MCYTLTRGMEGENMKKILVYGDSNVWGDNFITSIRLDDKKQWVNIVQNNKIDKFKILQEGLPGRIAGNYEVDKKYKNGKDTYLSTFKTCAPVDIVIIALGGNDLQLKYNRSSQDIIKDLIWYEDIINEEYKDIDTQKKYFVNRKLPQFIYILPTNFDYIKDASMIFDKVCEQKRQEIIKYFKNNNKIYISSNDISLVEDGIHYSEQGHMQMAKLVEGLLKDYE